MTKPELMGILTAHQAKGKKAFSFEYHQEWLNILIAPGSSLGGTRPKANILDENGELWIAKFPSKNDTVDKAAWEYLAYKLALKAGIEMASSKLEKISGNHHDFLTKRFDREGGERIHFSSAMTMIGYNEDILRMETASYTKWIYFLVFPHPVWTGLCGRDLPKAHFGGETNSYIPNHSGLDYPVYTGIDSVLLPY